MKLSREAIERVLGKQPPIEKVAPEKPKGTWTRMTDEERKRIIECKRKNPTYSYKELAKKFGRSQGVIWQLINGGAK